MRFSDKPQSVTPDDYRRWSRVEHSIAEDLNYTDAEIAELLDRTPGAVYMYRIHQGIKVKQQERNLDYDHARVMARWTPDEDQWLRDHSRLDMDVLVLQLGRSAPAIRKRFRDLRGS